MAMGNVEEGEFPIAAFSLVSPKEVIILIIIIVYLTEIKSTYTKKKVTIKP